MRGSRAIWPRARSLRGLGTSPAQGKASVTHSWVGPREHTTGVEAQGVRGQPCPCERAARSQGETPCEGRPGSQVTSSASRAGNSAGQCRAPEGRISFCTFLRGGLCELLHLAGAGSQTLG